MKHTIYIQNYLPSVISTRKAIENLTRSIILSNEEEYSFDFASIIFISRSFADEFIKYITNSDIHWSIVNANPNVSAMFEAINRSKKDSNRSFDHVAITSFPNKLDLNHFLTTI